MKIPIIFFVVCTALVFLLLASLVFAQGNPNSVHFPIISNGVSGPTETPVPPCPQTGYWFGTTDKRQPILFTIPTSPTCQATDFIYGLQVVCLGTSGSVTVTGTIETPSIGIADNRFEMTSNAGGRHELTGTFSSLITTTGTWSSTVPLSVGGSCANVGTWAAEHAFPITSTKLHLRRTCGGGQSRCLDTQPDSAISFIATHPADVLEYTTPLTGDIAGVDYGFSLILGLSFGATSANYRAEILVASQVLASTEFLVVTPNSSERFTTNMAGVDPSTQAGDSLTLRITHLSGDAGRVVMGRPASADSFIIIPGVASELETPTETPVPPTATPIPPTASPTLPCPQLGLWSGTTNQGQTLSFMVVDTPTCRVKDLHTILQLQCSSGSINADVPIPSIPISNNHFESGSGSNLVAGDFTSATTANGNWSYSVTDPNQGVCSASGTATANYASPMAPESQ